MGLPDALLTIPYKKNVPFSSLTTLGLGGLCNWLFEPISEEQAQLFVKTCRASDLPYRVLGGGSNIFAVSDISAPVMRLALPWALAKTEGGVWASASHGHIALAHEVAEMGFSGIEWACGIPGTFGGALRMNAGAHGGEWSQAVGRIRYLSPDGEIIEEETKKEDFSYRSSFLADGSIALGAAIKMAKGDVRSIKNKMAELLAARQKTQPSGRSAGCVFKNSTGKNAGQIIEQAGLKGMRVGDAEVSRVHANFLLNRGNAAPSDYWELICLVRAKVFETQGFELELELDVWDER
jgi:UDP-N-acetylmuramate dehydrogenase